MTTAHTSKPVEKRFSEVIHSTNELVIAQCYKENQASSTEKYIIAQGKVVKVKSSYDTSYAAFGLITKINNTSIDNIHKPSALGLDASELEHLQPQVYDLLRKELEICLFAFEKPIGSITCEQPPKPMDVHDFVFPASDKETLTLTENILNLANIIKKNGYNPNLLVDLINIGYKLRNNNYDYLVKIGQDLSITFADDVHSLMLILKRLSPNLRKT